MNNNRLVTKRAYDIRLFSVDVSGKLREGENVVSYATTNPVNSQIQGTHPSDTLNLTVRIPDPDIEGDFEQITDNKILNFYCGGGESGITYEISLRYSSTNESQLESVIYVKVV